MRIGVLKADSVLPNLREFGEYPDMFRAVLAQADPGLALDAFDVEHGEYPHDLDACDGYLITGSRHSVYDPLPWIPPLEDFVRRAFARKKKLLGVCFGHQFVAHALGGRTEPAPHGWTTGLRPSRLERPYPWAPTERREIRLVHCHKDQVTGLPPGAERIGGNDACPLGLYRIDDHVMSVQAHPEFTAEYARALYDTRRETLGEDVYREAVGSLAQEDDRLEFARWIASFFRGGATATKPTDDPHRP